MAELTEYINTLKTKYPYLHFNTYDIIEPHLNVYVSSINIIKITYNMSLDSNDMEPLVVIPGYSFKSFSTMTSILLESFDMIKNKYNHIILVNWGDKIKEISTEIVKDIKDEDTKYKINEDFRIKMANVLDKILRSPDMMLGSKFAILGKSAGGGIALYIASMNQSVDKLYLCAPATILAGKIIKDRDDLTILLSWNKDDNMIPYEKYKDFEDDFQQQNNKYKVYLYEIGGHELNFEFVKKL